MTGIQQELVALTYCKTSLDARISAEKHVASYEFRVTSYR